MLISSPTLDIIKIKVFSNWWVKICFLKFDFSFIKHLFLHLLNLLSLPIFLLDLNFLIVILQSLKKLILDINHFLLVCYKYFYRYISVCILKIIETYFQTSLQQRCNQLTPLPHKLPSATIMISILCIES